ncbi:MAG TPA: MBL fold metallo-hydrolase, partial [Candidatus Acetothermia bacterium]|nr:MBL fold metallo-hydrolase [Candidatus Acetothermia bacterium]
MIFRQMYDGISSTYTYVLADTASGAAVIIDPVYEQLNRDLALIRELGLRLLYTIDTHCHADHVTASWMLQHKTGCRIGAAAAIGAQNVDLELNHGDRIVFGEHALDV